MKLKTLLAGAVGAVILAGPAFSGDDNDMYEHPYEMCQRIVKYNHRVIPITKADRQVEIQDCLDHTTRYF